jgi:hypothetical protein
VSDGGALGQLVGAYLHQDWDIDYGSWSDAVDAYLQEAQPEAISEARRELTALISENPSEERIRDEMDQRGCSYYPPGDGTSYREWLDELGHKLALP